MIDDIVIVIVLSFITNLIGLSAYQLLPNTVQRPDFPEYNLQNSTTLRNSFRPMAVALAVRLQRLCHCLLALQLV